MRLHNINLLRKLRFKLRFSCISKSSSPPPPMVSHHIGLKVVWFYFCVYFEAGCLYLHIKSVFKL